MAECVQNHSGEYEEIFAISAALSDKYKKQKRCYPLHTTFSPVLWGISLVALLEGRATPETLWPDHVKPGDKYAGINLQGTIVTKDSYKDWVQKNSFEALSAGLKRS